MDNNFRAPPKTAAGQADLDQKLLLRKYRSANLTYAQNKWMAACNSACGNIFQTKSPSLLDRVVWALGGKFQPVKYAA
jgi:hypothetical protein